jgi:glycosyltransferase involved in cell wall biosynthesis
MEERRKRKILVSSGAYLPGFRGGGPIRSVANMVETLGNELDFKIITSDRDLGSRKAYAGIRKNQWQRVGKAEVFYISPDKIRGLFCYHLINSTCHDMVYLNSFFSPGFTILPLILRRLGLIGQKPTVVAPRGEFSRGALEIKSSKKKLYLYLAKLIGLYRNIVWHASSRAEELDIKAVFETAKVFIASNLMAIAPDQGNRISIERDENLLGKKTGSLRVVFLSRISSMKNLDGALKLLPGVKGEILFHIYGPMEDRLYWEKCQKLITTMPSNISIEYKGEIGHDEVTGVLSAYHLLFLPTRGENFGHIIGEALLVGCPVLISDQTPWRNLAEKGVGWDLPLSRPEQFRDVLQRFVNMDKEEYQAMSQRARTYSIDRIHDQKGIQDNRCLFGSDQR